MTVTITGTMRPHYAAVLTPESLAFVADLQRRFGPRRAELLALRKARQAERDAGKLPDFLPETLAIRAGDWTIRGIPADLLDRRVEITGPTDRKMLVNALNSGAKVFMADCEDALSPTWDNVVTGQVNLANYWRGTLDFTDETSGKRYAVGSKPAVLIIRPRGWHLDESHMLVDGKPIAGAFVDFGLYLFHNAKLALAKGSGPYFYLPKTESHLEARLWNDVFSHAESVLGLPKASIKVTLLIETLPAAFEMDEILHELKDYIVGLNCGRWDYIFSYIKTLRAHPQYLLPNRSDVVMGKAFLKAYSDLLIKTCHRRGAFAMGGMSAAIPNRRDPEVNAKAFAAVKADKEREASNGHDGTWVAHPDLVPIAMEVFDRLMPGKNQLGVSRSDVEVSQHELLERPDGARSEEGIRHNIRVAVQYTEAWLRGAGAVPLYNLMEDAATAEISRTSIWQWIRHAAKLDDGRTVSRELVNTLIDDEMAKLLEVLGSDRFANGRFGEAERLLRDLVAGDRLADFLTLPAYGLLKDEATA